MTYKKVDKKYWVHKKNVDIPTFSWRITIVFTNDMFEYVDKIKPDNDIDDLTSGVCINFFDDMQSFIVLTKEASPGDIAHEAWHAIRCMLTEVGAALDNEVVAYHLGYLVNQIHEIKKGIKN